MSYTMAQRRSHQRWFDRVVELVGTAISPESVTDLFRERFTPEQAAEWVRRQTGEDDDGFDEWFNEVWRLSELRLDRKLPDFPRCFDSVATFFYEGEAANSQVVLDTAIAQMR